jgi:hypothetical protein
MSEEQKIVSLVQKTIDPAGALAIIDDLRAKVESGEIVCFAAVGLNDADGTFLWSGGLPGRKSRLQVLGAMENMKLHYWSGAIKA